MMGILENQRWELFAQGIAKGLTQGQAYVQAGYRPSPSAPSRLFENVRIKERVEELVGRKAVNIIVNKQFVLEALIENLSKALGRKPVQIGADGKDVYLYKGDVANAALKMLGSEVGLFVGRTEVRISNEFEKMTDAELAEEMQRTAKLLLED